MARLITIIILCLCYIQAFSEEHLKFLGFPIDGSVNEYASKLKSKGFYVSPDNKYASVGASCYGRSFPWKYRTFWFAL